MYLLINRKDMSVLCSAKTREQIAAEPSSLILLVDSEAVDGFKPFTALELKLLYRGLGQVPGTVINERASVIRSINKLLRYRPVDSAMHLPIFNESDRAKPKASSNAGATGPDPAPAGTTALAPKGGVRAMVWDVADRMWEAAGKPKDVQVVMKLRKDMMVELEHACGVKRTSSSNELGSWMKTRILA